MPVARRAARALAQGEGARKPIFRELLALALPLTGMRLVSALMQTVNASLIPARLRLFGLSAAEQAMASLGVFHGMLKPILFMPSFITCSLSMAASPELTRLQTEGRPLACLSGVCSTARSWSGAARCGVLVTAPLIAHVFFRQAALLPLLRGSCPLIPVIAMAHVCGGIMNALGLQSASLKISLASSLTAVTAVSACFRIAVWGAVVSLARRRG